MITAITLTLYNRDSATQDIINSLSDQNVLNVDRGTMHPTNGLLTLQLLPAEWSAPQDVVHLMGL